MKGQRPFVFQLHRLLIGKPPWAHSELSTRGQGSVETAGSRFGQENRRRRQLAILDLRPISVAWKAFCLEAAETRLQLVANLANLRPDVRRPLRNHRFQPARYKPRNAAQLGIAFTWRGGALGLVLAIETANASQRSIPNCEWAALAHRCQGLSIHLGTAKLVHDGLQVRAG